MNPRERFMTAMRGGQPDRVPIAEFMLDTEVIKAACPGVKDPPDFCDRMDLDAVYCRTIYKRVREFVDRVAF